MSRRGQSPVEEGLCPVVSAVNARWTLGPMRLGVVAWVLSCWAAVALAAGDYAFIGPAPAREFVPIQLIFLNLPFERAATLPAALPTKTSESSACANATLIVIPAFLRWRVTPLE